MGEIIFINWDIHTLFGWENEKSDLVIDAIIRGIEAGDNFPPVPVHKKGDSVFYLSPLRETPDGLPDAGHYRAIGHYITNTPLKCELLNDGPIWPDDMCTSIQDIIIIADNGQYGEHKARFSDYR